MAKLLAVAVLAVAVAVLAWVRFICPDCDALALRAGYGPGHHNPCCPRCGDVGKIGVWNRLRGSPVTPEIAGILREAFPPPDYNDGLRNLLERLMGADAPRCFEDARGRAYYPLNVRVFDTPEGWRVAVLIWHPGRREGEPVCARTVLLDARGRYLDLLEASTADEIFWRFVAPGLELSVGFKGTAIRLLHGGRPEPVPADRTYVVRGDRFAPRP